MLVFSDFGADEDVILVSAYDAAAPRFDRPRALPNGVAESIRAAVLAVASVPRPRCRVHYAAWLEALPENLQDSATAEALQAICDLDLTELQAIVPPRGFGRD